VHVRICVWDFAGQKGAVRGVLRGGSGRGVHPQGVSVISSLKRSNLMCPYHLERSMYVVYMRDLYGFTTNFERFSV